MNWFTLFPLPFLPLPFLPPSKINKQLYFLNFCPGEDLPSTLSFRNVPERHYSAISVHFCVVLVHCAKLSINKNQILPSSVIGHGELSIRPQVYWGRENIVTGMGTTDIRATSSCKFFVPAGPAQVHSHIYHSYLMVDFCCVNPDLVWQVR